MTDKPFINPPPPDKWLDTWNATVRASLGKPPLPVLDDLPADVRAILEMV